MEMDKTKIVEKVLEELTICYVNRGVAANAALPAVAESLAESIDFRDADQVHAVFRKAKDVESIPTQKTLKEAWKNLHEEFIKYAETIANNPEIGYDDPRAAWLPADDLKKAINLRNAIKNLCVAMGGDMYLQYCKSHATRVEEHNGRKVVFWGNESAAKAFDEPVKAKLKELYTKYIRSIPMYDGYPSDSKLNLGLIPPTVDEFKWMIQQEAANET